MNDAERGLGFKEMKATRDQAKSDPCILQRRHLQLAGRLKVALQALRRENGMGWRLTSEGLRFGPKQDGGVYMDSGYPQESELREVLASIDESEQAIRDYNALVE